MANVLSEEKRQQVLGLGRLGWPLRRIEKATGIRRETASRYLKAAGISIRSPRGWGRRPATKAANEVWTDPGPANGAKPANEVSTDSRSGPWPPEQFLAETRAACSASPTRVGVRSLRPSGTRSSPGAMAFCGFQPFVRAILLFA
jgi:hypothetical protein